MGVCVCVCVRVCVYDNVLQQHLIHVSLSCFHGLLLCLALESNIHT